MIGTFRCARCEGLFEKARSDEEAVAEKEELWPYDKVEDCVLICEDCFQQLRDAGLVPEAGPC